MSGTESGHDEGGELFSFAQLPSGPHRLPREVVRENQRRRILLAALDVFAAKGFAATTVQDLLREAQVSRATFYEIFADKAACLTALHEEVLDWMWERVAAVLTEVPDWHSRVRVAVGETVRLLTEDPRLAAVGAIEAPAGLPQVRARHDRLLEDLGAALRTGRQEISDGRALPEILETALVSGSIYLVRRSIVFGFGPDPDELVAQLPELLLFPYAG